MFTEAKLIKSCTKTRKYIFFMQLKVWKDLKNFSLTSRQTGLCQGFTYIHHYIMYSLLVYSFSRHIVFWNGFKRVSSFVRYNLFFLLKYLWIRRNKKQLCDFISSSRLNNSSLTVLVFVLLLCALT